ncbi:hypothetical protein [Paenibacillus silvisoli]|uniref:hypothetical protein n=1 Tax=Paenibacillus silvisoli TaxID=3110539 RepID=UPI0028052545|nr:hypothetical protein [Paenibacillus silvisoli]
MSASSNWQFEPNEAFDMILFLNAMSDDPFYNQHYADVREKWGAKLGESGAARIQRVRSMISMSELCSEVSRLDIKTLDEMIGLFSNAGESSLMILGATLHAKRETFFQCFRLLKEIELDQTWESRIKPYLLEMAQRYHLAINSEYSLSEIENEIRTFLGAPHLICSKVYLSTYIKPIAFRLPDGAMVMHPAPNGQLQLPRHFAQLWLHESLHGFPDSEIAQNRQNELRKTNAPFEQRYEELMSTYNSGPEEYFVVGAEAYLSSKLNIRTHEECMDYLARQNGGMPLSLAIYKRLRETNPEQDSNWSGYGKWLDEQLMSLL